MDDKDKKEIQDTVKAAMAEADAEKQAEFEKEAQERADARELGVRAYMKKAGIEDDKEQELLLQVAGNIEAAAEG